MTEEELKRLEALSAAATPGPWHDSDHDCVGGRDGFEDLAARLLTPTGTIYLSATEPTGKGNLFESAEFIAAARDAVPKLVALVRHADAEIRRLRGLIETVERSTEPGYGDAAWCPWCGAGATNGGPMLDPGKSHAADCAAFTPEGEVR